MIILPSCAEELRTAKQRNDLKSLSGQPLQVTCSLTCSFAANYQFNFPRPAPIWPCSSVGKATEIVPAVVGSNPTGVRDFLSPCGPISFPWAIAQKVLFGIFIQHFNTPHFNHYIICKWSIVKIHSSQSCNFKTCRARLLARKSVKFNPG